jgi:hypothetical protein
MLYFEGMIILAFLWLLFMMLRYIVHSRCMYIVLLFTSLQQNIIYEHGVNKCNCTPNPVVFLFRFRFRFLFYFWFIGCAFDITFTI